MSADASHEATMIDRVAMALREEESDISHLAGKKLARVAIGAMRDPDASGMLRAGMLRQELLGKTGISVGDTWSVWEAMIDAALAEDAR